jgi:multidrug efflux pump
MLFATFLGLLLIPVFYVVVRQLLGDKLDEVSHKMPHHGDGGGKSDGHEGGRHEGDAAPDEGAPTSEWR